MPVNRIDNSRRLTSLSSTTSAGASAPVRALPAAIGSGTENQNVLPSPATLSAPICPPMRSTRPFAIASPRPVPP